MLCLKDVGYASLPRLISGCPNLEILRVTVKEEDDGELEDHNHITVISVPRLRSLYMNDARNQNKGGVFAIEAPCLEDLNIIDDVGYDSRRIENMPDLTEAHVDITQGVTHRFLRALASTRRLYLCVSLLSEVPSVIIYFYRLVHLELNTVAQGWWEILTQMLQSSPKLASLKLTGQHELGFISKETPDSWKQPSSIPDSLEKFVWNGYKGRQGDLQVATYITKKATRLKTATFLPQCNNLEAKYNMLKDLVSLSTPTTSCQLLFE